MDSNDSQNVGNVPNGSVGNDHQGLLDVKKGEPVAYESFSKLLGQLKKMAEEKEQLSGQILAFETEKHALEEAELAKQGEYKKLLDMRSSEINVLKEQLKNEINQKELASRTLVDAQKLQAVYDELPGKLIKSEYADRINLDTVAFDPETGEVDVESAKVAANEFSKRYSELIDTSFFQGLPSNASSKGISLKQDFKSLPLGEMRGKISQAVKQKRKELGV